MSTSADFLRPHTDLPQLKRRAKDLLKAYRSAAPDAIALIVAHYRDADPAAFQLSDAQLVIARAAGFASWPKLVAFVAAQIAARQTYRGAPYQAHTVHSTQHLQLGWIDPDGANDPTGNQEHTIGGTTEGGKVVDVPPSRIWFIEYDASRHTAWQATLHEIRQRQIPGLNLRGDITDTMLADLAGLDHLRYLSLSKNATLTDAGLRHLAPLTRLEYFNAVNCTTITDHGLAVLRAMPNLRVIRFYGSHRVDDHAIRHLAQHQYLEAVTLDDTQCGDLSLKYLSGKPITHLSIGSRTTDAGLLHLRHYPGLLTPRPHSPWHKLDVYRGPSPTWLRLDSPSLTDAGLAILSELHAVTHIELPAHKPMPGISPAALLHITAMPALQNMAVPGCVITDTTMPAIATMARLASLSLWDAHATDTGIAQLARSTSITDIFAGKFHNLGPAGVAALATMPHLTKLSIGSRNCPDTALAPLQHAPALRDFATANENIFTDTAFQYIARIPHLETLTNMYRRAPEIGNTTGDRATAHLLAHARQLKSYGIWSANITDQSCADLARIPTLERLLLYNCPGVSDHGIRQLAALPKFHTLDLQSMPAITPEIATAFDRSVTINHNQ